MKILLTLLVVAIPALLARPSVNQDNTVKKAVYHPEVGLDTVELIKVHKYEVETHPVETPDGYILQMFRIPKGKNDASSKADRPIAFLMHGLLSSSAEWVNNGDDSLAYLLADAGYDVWLGNARGNHYADKHKKLDKNANASLFWDFTWHEIGSTDLPTEIDYVLAKTGKENVFYVAHSQGSTALFVMLSTRPEYNKKIKVASIFAPVAIMKHAENKLLKLTAIKYEEVKWVLNDIMRYQFFTLRELNDFLMQVCTLTPLSQVCVDLIGWTVGDNPSHINAVRVPVYLSNIPAGAASKQVLHYAQLKRDGGFRQFDYGKEANLKIYGLEIPPSYDMSVVTAPIAFYYGANDNFAHVVDVEELYRMLKNGVKLQKIDDKNFSHWDFFVHLDVVEKIYHPVMEYMKQYL